MFNQLAPRPLGLDSCCFPLYGMPFFFLSLMDSQSQHLKASSFVKPLMSSHRAHLQPWCPLFFCTCSRHSAFQLPGPVCISVSLMEHPASEGSALLPSSALPIIRGPAPSAAQSRCSANTCRLTCWRRPRKTSKWAKEEWVRQSASQSMGPAWNMKQASIQTKAWVQKGINQEVQECSEIPSPNPSDFRANVQRLLHVPFS